MSTSWVLLALTRSAAAHEHAELNTGRGLEELDSPSGSSETPKCSRCGRDGPKDYNCCHPGGAWAGVCGDEGMGARGAANFTYVRQERLKRTTVRGTAAEGPTKALSNAHHCVESLRALSAMTTGAMPQHHATGHVVRMTPYYWHSPNVDHHH